MHLGELGSCRSSTVMGESKSARGMDVHQGSWSCGKATSTLPWKGTAGPSTALSAITLKTMAGSKLRTLSVLMRAELG